MIAIETAGPERLTFVHQIDTVELPTSAPRHGSVGQRERNVTRFGYMGYLSPALRVSQDRASWRRRLARQRRVIDTTGDFFDFA